MAILKVRDAHVGTLERILAVHEQSGADDKVQSNAMSALSEAYIAHGSYAEAEKVLDRLVGVESDVAQHQEKPGVFL